MSRVYAATPQASPQATPQSCECPFPQGYCPFPQGYCPPPQFCGNYAKPYGTPTSYGTPTPYGTPQGPSASPQWAPTPGPAYYPSPQARSAAKASAVR